MIQSIMFQGLHFCYIFSVFIGRSIKKKIANTCKRITSKDPSFLKNNNKSNLFKSLQYICAIFKVNIMVWLLSCIHHTPEYRLLLYSKLSIFQQCIHSVRVVTISDQRKPPNPSHPLRCHMQWTNAILL